MKHSLTALAAAALLGFAGAVSIARFVAERDKAVRWEDPDTRPGGGAQ